MRLCMTPTSFRNLLCATIEDGPLKTAAHRVASLKARVGCANLDCDHRVLLEYAAKGGAPVDVLAAFWAGQRLELAHVGPKSTGYSVGDFNGGNGSLKGRMYGVALMDAASDLQVPLCRQCHDNLDGRVS